VTPTTAEGQRIHEAFELATERLADVLEGARFERRDGYAFMSFPTLPIPTLNGALVETDAAATQLDGAYAEARELGTPFTVIVRSGRTPAVERAARELGFTSALRIPGMAVGPDELIVPSALDVEVIRVETADGLAQANAVAATGFGIPPELTAAVYALEVVEELDGLEYYLARLGAVDVSTAAGFTLDGVVAIYNVATPAEFRGRGYGATITAHAAVEGFAAGADLAALQSSSMGESVYRRLGFREVETYLAYMRPPEVSGTS
jgi:ribosomal protein S18 acetylase RimI-like enzyme